MPNQADAQVEKVYTKGVHYSKHLPMKIFPAGQQLYCSELQFGTKWYSRIPVAI